MQQRKLWWQPKQQQQRGGRYKGGVFDQKCICIIAVLLVIFLIVDATFVQFHHLEWWCTDQSKYGIQIIALCILMKKCLSMATTNITTSSKVFLATTMTWWSPWQKTKMMMTITAMTKSRKIQVGFFDNKCIPHCCSFINRFPPCQCKLCAVLLPNRCCSNQSKCSIPTIALHILMKKCLNMATDDFLNNQQGLCAYNNGMMKAMTEDKKADDNHSNDNEDGEDPSWCLWLYCILYCCSFIANFHHCQWLLTFMTFHKVFMPTTMIWWSQWLKNDDNCSNDNEEEDNPS